MKIISSHFVYFIIICLLSPNQSLVELPQIENNFITMTESMMRKVTNDIFYTLKLAVHQNPKLEQFKVVHSFFTSITLKDQDNLNELARLTNVYEIDNTTQHFITEINDILNEDNKNKDAAEDVYVAQYIENFITRLKNLKEKYGFNKKYSDVNINSGILKHLEDKNNFSKVHDTAEEDYMQSDLEVWRHIDEDMESRRIYQGKRTKIKNFPFMASVQFFKKFQCGGTIIKSDLVITAASCLQLAWNNRFFRENPMFLSVQIGSDYYEGGGENIAVLEIYFYPTYTPKTLKDNLAIMRLVRRIRFRKKGKKVKKINFDRNAWALPFNTPGITIVGWGARQSSNIIGNPFSNRLAYAVLDVYPLEDCQEVYSKEYVTRKHFCAGFISKGGGACNRDVGGPGISDDILVGVISFGPVNCGTPDSPTVFTKLGYYTDWIEEIMEQDVPNEYKRTTLRKPKTIYEFDIKTTTVGLIKPMVTKKYEKQNNFIHEMLADNINPSRLLHDDSLFDDFISTLFDNEDDEDVIIDEQASPQTKADQLRNLYKDRIANKSKVTSQKHETDDYEDENDKFESVLAYHKTQIIPETTDSGQAVEQSVIETENGSYKEKQFKMTVGIIDETTTDAVIDDTSRDSDSLDQNTDELSIEVDANRMTTKAHTKNYKKDTQPKQGYVEDDIKDTTTKEEYVEDDINDTKPKQAYKEEDVLFKDITRQLQKLENDVENTLVAAYDDTKEDTKGTKLNESIIDSLRIENNTKQVIKNDHINEDIDKANELIKSFFEIKDTNMKLKKFKKDKEQRECIANDTCIMNKKHQKLHTYKDNIQEISVVTERNNKIKKLRKKVTKQGSSQNNNKIKRNKVKNQIASKNIGEIDLGDKIDKALSISNDKVEIDIMKLIESLDIRKWMGDG